MRTARQLTARAVCAQILNFSIAYGKTKHGLSRDWNVSLKEAEQTVNAWYSDRPEVKAWQDEQHRLVQETGRVRVCVCDAVPN
jgi:DNA polymerase-1